MPATLRPVMLVVLDGWGWREDPTDNAVRQAQTPIFNRLWQECPHAFLRTSGLDVGLPEGQMGNSEVGHLNIGAGRVVMQDLPRIDQAIADGSIAQLPVLQDLIAKLRESGGTCHLMGLVSPGGVHAHQDHAVALARVLVAAGVPTVMHAFTDGRDTPPRSGDEAIRRLRMELPASVRIVTRAGLKQLRMAETEKYPHVTYFLNGGDETPNPGEDRIMVPSPKVATYDLQPEMSAPELTDKAVAAIDSAAYDLIVLNFANA